MTRFVDDKLTVAVLTNGDNANAAAIVAVTREGDKLMIQQGQGEKRELLPESEVNFFTEPTSRTIYTFTKDDSGQGVLVIKQDDREVWRAKRIK